MILDIFLEQVINELVILEQNLNLEESMFEYNTKNYSKYPPIFGLVWIGCVIWHINPCGLFNARFCLYIYVNKPKKKMLQYYTSISKTLYA